VEFAGDSEDHTVWVARIKGPARAAVPSAKEGVVQAGAIEAIRQSEIEVLVITERYAFAEYHGSRSLWRHFENGESGQWRATAHDSLLSKRLSHARGWGRRLIVAAVGHDGGGRRGVAFVKNTR